MPTNISNEKRYSIFIFLSMFSKGMAEIFIPVVLYNKGFNLSLIFLYFSIKYLVIIITYYLVVELAKIIRFKVLLVLSAIMLGISFYLLTTMGSSISNLLIAATLFALYTETYWAGRHYYALEVIPSKNLSCEVGNIIIAGEIGLIPSAYLGGLAIELLGLKYLTIIITLIALISIIPLLKIKEFKDKEPINASIILKEIPKKSMLYLIFDQFKYLTVLFFPLYLYLNVVENYRYIGIVNVAIGIASMIFVYLFAKKMDKNKKDYLSLGTICLALVLVFKLNITNPLVMIVIGLFEGLATKMQMTSVIRNIYALGQHYNTISYLIVIELIQNIGRFIILGYALLFINNLIEFLAMCIFLFSLASVLEFNTNKNSEQLF
ncbi:MAG: MFS transporter [Bacilli bacterium]|nr:MFS transporter [Bacilli bacterium]